MGTAGWTAGSAASRGEPPHRGPDGDPATLPDPAPTPGLSPGPGADPAPGSGPDPAPGREAAGPAGAPADDGQQDMPGGRSRALPAAGAPSWPEEPPPEPRGDWKDTLRDASDLALLGIAMTVAALPVLTAGAAVGAASAALHDRYATGSWPTARTSLGRYGRGLLPGLAVTAVATLVGGLLAVNLRALSRGFVPGGLPLILVTAVLTLAVGGFAALVIVEVGRRGGRDWLTAVRAATEITRRRPVVPLAVAGVLGATTVIGTLVMTIILPILAGYTLFALYAVATRLTRPV